MVGLGVAIFLLASLWSLQLGSGRLMGPFGRAFAVFAYALFGVGAHAVALGLGFVAIRKLIGRSPVARWTHLAGGFLGLAALGTLLHLALHAHRIAGYGPGGLLGEHLAEVSRAVVSTAGTALLAGVFLLVAVVIATPLRMGQVLHAIGRSLKVVALALFRGTRAGARELGGFLADVVRAILPERDRDEIGDDAGDEVVEDVDDDIVELTRKKGEPVIHDPRRDGVPTDELAGDTEKLPENQIAALLAAEVRSQVAPKKSRGKRGTMPGLGEGIEPAVVDAAATAVDADANRATIKGPALVPAPNQTTRGPIIVESQFKQTRAAEMKAKEKAVDGQRKDFIMLGDGAFKLPPINLLEYDDTQAVAVDKNAMLEMSARLTQTLEHYGIKGAVTEIKPGPVVTMYEFAPAPGTRISKIANLSDDLAMALEALKVRIVAPIPGKAVVGIEVPNRTRETVYLKEILANDAFVGSKMKLPMALGKDIAGGPSVVDLAKMPHLLVAGTTGSGKSVAVNAMITSLLYHMTPEDVRLIMVDPKMLELSIYEGIPHLLLPVVTDPKKANLALRWAVDEMERRYDLLSRMGVRDIGSYNQKVAKLDAKQLAAALARAAAEAAIAAEDSDGIEITEDDEVVEVTTERQPDLPYAEPPRKLPYIVVVIDEFADLMMCAPKEVETSVARIAQKARAAGIHLILATQRPSVDVITGLIKANFPSRIAFHVTAKVDSRTILDQMGAENLLGSGDMLFSDRGSAPARLHGCFVNEEEIHRVVDFLKKQGKPVYNLEILKPRDEDGEDGGAAEDSGGGGSDDLYDRAVRIVAETQRVSISYLQRRLTVGYNRAAKLVEKMESEGVVSPPDHKNVRQVLAAPAA